MPRFSRYTPFGHFAFSAKPSHGESIYNTLRANFGAVFSVDDDGRQQARLYAQAMCLATAQYQFDRAANNRIPTKASELLPALERDYQVVPGPRATLFDRGRFLAAIQRITRGNRREAIEDALRTLLGANFIEYRTTAKDQIEVMPDLAASSGVFARIGTKKKLIRLDAPVVQRSAFITIPYTKIGGSDAPLKGEAFCVDPDPRRAAERVTIAAVTATTITAVFAQSHDTHTLAVSPHPLWASNQRYDTVVVSTSAANDPEARRKINELMAHALRGVSQWQVITNAGYFTTDDPILGLPDSVPVM